MPTPGGLQRHGVPGKLRGSELEDTRYEGNSYIAKLLSGPGQAPPQAPAQHARSPLASGQPGAGTSLAAPGAGAGAGAGLTNGAAGGQRRLVALPSGGRGRPPPRAPQTVPVPEASAPEQAVSQRDPRLAHHQAPVRQSFNHPPQHLQHLQQQYPHALPQPQTQHPQYTQHPRPQLQRQPDPHTQCHAQPQVQSQHLQQHAQQRHLYPHEPQPHAQPQPQHQHPQHIAHAQQPQPQHQHPQHIAHAQQPQPQPLPEQHFRKHPAAQLAPPRPPIAPSTAAQPARGTDVHRPLLADATDTTSAASAPSRMLSHLSQSQPSAPASCASGSISRGASTLEPGCAADHVDAPPDIMLLPSAMGGGMMPAARAPTAALEHQLNPAEPVEASTGHAAAGPAMTPVAPASLLAATPAVTAASSPVPAAPVSASSLCSGAASFAPSLPPAAASTSQPVSPFPSTVQAPVPSAPPSHGVPPPPSGPSCDGTLQQSLPPASETVTRSGASETIISQDLLQPRASGSVASGASERMVAHSTVTSSHPAPHASAASVPEEHVSAPSHGASHAGDPPRQPDSDGVQRGAPVVLHHVQTAPPAGDAAAVGSAPPPGRASEIIAGRLSFVLVASHPFDSQRSHYFNVDELLPYEAFFKDFGPLHLAHAKKFIDLVDAKLRDPTLHGKAIYFYSMFHDAEKATNATVLIGLYAIWRLHATAAQALAAVANWQHCWISYRDASPVDAPFDLTVADVLQAAEKAQKLGWFDVDSFDAEAYEHYEQLVNGDWHWVIPGMALAFSGPNGPHTSFTVPQYVQLFRSLGVTTVIRLNEKCYDEEEFRAAGMEHVDLVFPDGTVPPPSVAEEFLRYATAGRSLAVHCKAGLGRTGTLIALKLIRDYGFSARESIAWIRLCRPGSVIGCQQDYLVAYDANLRAGRADPLPKGVDLVIGTGDGAGSPAHPDPPLPVNPPSMIETSGQYVIGKMKDAAPEARGDAPSSAPGTPRGGPLRGRDVRQQLRQVPRKSSLKSASRLTPTHAQGASRGRSPSATGRRTVRPTAQVGSGGGQRTGSVNARRGSGSGGAAATRSHSGGRPGGPRRPPGRQPQATMIHPPGLASRQGPGTRQSPGAWSLDYTRHDAAAASLRHDGVNDPCWWAQGATVRP